MSKKKKKIALQSGNKLSGRRAIYLLFAAILIGLLGFLINASYLGLSVPFIPKGLARATDVSITYLPFVPKTSKQVVTRAFFEMGRIKSGEHVFNLELAEEDNGSKKTVIAPKIVGQFREENGELDLAGEASVDGPGGDKLKINFVEKDKFLYFKLNNVPNILGLDFTKVGEDWNKIDVDKIINQGNAKVRGDSDIKKDVKGKEDILYDTLAAEKIFEKTTVSSEGSSFKYQIDLGESEIDKIAKVFFPKGLSQLKKLNLALFIDKSSYRIQKLEAIGEISSLPVSQTSGLSISAPETNFKFSYQLKEANEKLEIKAPEAREIESLFSLYLLVQGGKKEDPANLIFGATKSLPEFGANFLTIERLIHVLYLAPLSL
ncbi:MAG: hypothetical protein WD231_00885 [Candidatus Woykebacteria bacterium]